MERLCYRGGSMNPTLIVSDIIGVVPYEGRTIRVGDVIVFNGQDDGRMTVHRVVLARSGRIITRGDNNSANDPYGIKAEQVIGQVVCAWRGKRCRRVHGGPVGRLHALRVRAVRRMGRSASFLLHPIYVACARSGIVSRFFSLQSRTRVISIQRPSGTELQLLLGRTRIGILPPFAKRWQIRRPFGLFIAENRLPSASGMRTRVQRSGSALQ
jgi:signal peptidase